ncbi:MAG: hypothetical protein ACYC7E_10650 [Armatimonadota bacterium]
MRPRYILTLLAALLVLAFARPLLLRAQTSPPGTTPPAIDAAAASEPVVTTRMATLNGRAVGEVLINNRVVMRLAATRGYTAGERATLVAERLRSLLAQGHTWNDVRASTMDNRPVLMVGNNRLVTILPADAQVHNMTASNLAQSWTSSLQVALRASGTVVAGSEEQWPDWTTARTKIVPIISLGTPGVQIGAAQIKGPAERIDAVRGVLQLELTFQNAVRIKAFVPSSSLTSLNRVQGVAVSALLQYSLFRF